MRPGLAMGAVIVLILSACGQSDGRAAEAVPTAVPTAVAAETEPSDRGAGDDGSTLDGAVALPPAGGLDEAVTVARSGPEPTTLTIPAIDIADVAIRPVAVEANGDMTVPPPLDVGWYRLGPLPGAPTGSAVLAGHIASGGVDGAFRHLDQLEPGDPIQVGFDDGTTRAFVVATIDQYAKPELPVAGLFARSGPAQLALITCGGAFDTTARSYEDNVVVVADPA